MSRYYSYMLITFTDGTTERVGGNKTRVSDGILTVYTDIDGGTYGNARRFPLVNIREYHWEDEEQR